MSLFTPLKAAPIYLFIILLSKLLNNVQNFVAVISFQIAFTQLHICVGTIKLHVMVPSGYLPSEQRQNLVRNNVMT